MKCNSFYTEITKVVVFIMCSVFILPLSADAALPSGFEIQTLATGLNLPTTMAFTADGRVFIAEKDGTVRVYKNGALLANPLIRLTDVNNYGDRGLIGMAVDPNFATNGYLYLSYTYENTPGANFAGTKTGRIVRVKVVGDTASESTKVVLVGTVGGDITNPSCQNFLTTDDCIPSDSSAHSVGGLRFGPDGKLYASLGDGSSFDYVDVNAQRAQNIDSLAGKLLRINTDGTAPTDNPFYNGSANANRSKVYAYGFRNMYRFNFKPETSMLFGGDVGWSSWEEINRIVSGGNYAWPCREGATQTAGYTCVAPSPRDPLYYYAHNAFGAGAVTSGAFPTGSAYPVQYLNTFFFGDYAQNVIRQMSVNTSGVLLGVSDFAEGADGTDGPVDFVTGPEGNVYFLAIYTGELKRITHTLGNRQPIVFISATPTAGVAPLTVNFSSGGTNDPDGDAFTYLWNFADGVTSVLPNPSHAYTQNGSFNATLTVRDNRGGVQTKSVLITVGNRPPTAQITSPQSGDLYSTGESLLLTGSGNDPENGVLPNSALTWRVILHHNTHTHVLETRIGNNIAFTGPDHSDPAVYTQVELTVTDSAGLTNTMSINMYLDNGAGQSGNLVPNPSLEVVDPLDSALPRYWGTDWWGNLAPIFTYPVAGYEGGSARAAKLQVTQYTAGDAKWTFSPAYVGENVLMTFSDYYQSNTDSAIIAEIGFADGSRRYIALGDVPAATAWTKFTGTFTTPPGTRNVSVFHVLNGVGILTIDNFSLEQGVTPPTNMITNPSFETVNGSSPLGWTPSGWGPNDRTFTYPVAGRTGVAAAQTKMVNYTDGDTKWVPDNVAVTPGVEYTYSDWYTADDISDIIGMYTMDDGRLIYFGVTKELPPTTVWRKATGNFIPPAGARLVTFLHLVSSPATLTIDDASLTTSTGTYVDTEHPAVTITAPTAGNVVSGTVTISADAIDNIAVASVQFFVDGVPLGALDTTAPYSVSWDTLAFANGAHTLSARARDTAGVSATNTIAVSVSNTTTTNPNLITNPSLETGANPDGSGDPATWQRGKWGTNNAIFTYPVAGFGTTRAAQVQMTTYADGDAKWYFAPVMVTAGQSYQFSNKYKSTISTAIVARYTLAGGAFSYAQIGTVAPVTNWTTFSTTITPPANATQVVIFHVLSNVGTLTVDDYALTSLSGQPNPDLFQNGMVSMSFDDGWISHYTNVLPILNAANMKGSFEIVSLETLDALPDNRVSNPSLETADASGNPVDWMMGNWGANNAVFTYPVGGQAGARGARVSITSYGDGDAKWYFKDSAVIDGADYSISDYYMSDVSTKITVRYNMGNNVFTYVDVATLPPAATWTQFTRQITIPANVESFTFFHRLDRVGSLSIDNVDFSKVQIFVSPAQVLTMQSQGHEIDSHTRMHPSLTSIPSAQMQTEIIGSRNDLLAMGVTTVNMLVYPYGDYNGETKSVAATSGYVGARSADTGYNTRSTDKFALKVQQITVTTSVDEIKAWINKSVADKTWLILMFHQVDSSGKQLSTVTLNFQAIVDYLAIQQVPIVTMQQGVAQMN